MNSSSPWGRLSVPSTQTDITIIRVDDDHRWELFWGRSKDHYLLIARLKGGVAVPGKLPKFKGVQLTLNKSMSGAPRSLMLELLDDEAVEIFRLLCQDIIEATRTVSSAQELVQEMVARTWMWHRFLQKGKSGLLTAEEQRGLIGELTILKQVCLPAYGKSLSIEGWTGPVGTARDFEFGATCLEVKARRAPALPFVEINSEFQLDPEGLDALFLYVVDVTATVDDTGLTLSSIVETLRNELSVDGEALDLFDERLSAAGFRSTDDYSEWHWAIGEFQVFQVTEEFPCIRHSRLPAGLSSVEYRLSLHLCQPFEILQSRVESLLGVATHGE
jgi:hypothetical protein